MSKTQTKKKVVKKTKVVKAAKKPKVSKSVLQASKKVARKTVSEPRVR